MKISFKKIKKQLPITIGNIIRSKDFANGMSSSTENEIRVGFPDKSYQYYLNNKQLNVAHDPSRSSAFFLVLSMEIVEVLLPQDVAEKGRYMGVNVKCIRLLSENSMDKYAERICFTLNHDMSLLDMADREIEIVGNMKLPIFWTERFDVNQPDEKVF